MPLFYIIIAVFILGGLVVFIRRLNGPERLERFRKEFQSKYADTLDLSQTDVVDEGLVQRLNSALTADFMEKVNTEFRLQFPRLTQKRVNEYWRELKRYFLLAAVFKKVEMFNVKIDELWHIMLKHEAEYDEFCEQFIGQKILHIPHTQPTFKPVERTLFDFCYVQMFSVDSIALKVWGKFFKHGKGEEFLQEFENEQIQTLKDKYMLQEASSLAESTFESFTARCKEDKTEKTSNWHKLYNQNNDASYGYFVYADSDNHDNSFKEIFGLDSSGSHGHGSHKSHDSGHSDSGSSCSSCSSCSSS